MKDTHWKVRRAAVAAVAALAGLVAAACGDATANPGGEGAELALVETRDLVLRVEASGEIEPLRVVEVKSNAGGEVIRLHVDTGDEVEQGALLAEIDPRDVRNTHAQAAADVQVARASVQTREAALRRATELREAGIMTVQEFESAQLDATSARAQLVRAQTNLELANERMRDITIRAPMSGTVVQKQVEAGQIVASATGNVSGGSTLLVMADLSAMQVRTLVDQTDIGKLRVGQPASVTVDAYPGRTFEGVVTRIEPQATVEQNVTMFPVLVRLENAERLLLPGMNADVEVRVDERRNVAVVPNGAVVGVRAAAQTAAALGLDESALRDAMRGQGGPRGERGPPPAVAAADGGEAGRAAAGSRGARGGAGGDAARSPSAAGAAAGRAGVVFVMGDSGIEPRVVSLGLNDLDHTEVVRGVREGERVMLMTLAQVQQQQQQMQDRMRERSGGFPGAGGGGGGRGGR